MAGEFLPVDEVVAIHEDQIRHYGGLAGIRDVGLLQSAVAMPQAGFGGEYLHEFPHEMAAAYLFHLARNHPFIDGNKRAALSTALVFLDLNGLRLECDPDALYDLVFAVAASRAGKAEATQFFKQHTQPAKP